MSELSELSNLCEDSRELDREIKETERRLKELKARRHMLLTDVMPAFMQEVGIDSVDTPDGYRVTLGVWCSVKWPAKADDGTRPGVDECFEWLKSQNLGSIVKNEFKIQTGRNETEKAAEIEQELQAADIPYTKDVTVHYQTLNAALKENVEQGGEFPPEDIFPGAYYGPIVKIKDIK